MEDLINKIEFLRSKEIDKIINELDLNLEKTQKPDELNHIWLSVSEAANIGGIGQKTIRRAIQSNKIEYKIIKSRYSINLYSLIEYLHTNTKLKNKFYRHGIGQFFISWLSALDIKFKV